MHADKSCPRSCQAHCLVAQVPDQLKANADLTLECRLCEINKRNDLVVRLNCETVGGDRGRSRKTL